MSSWETTDVASVPAVRVAVYDLGSSSFHLMVVDVSRGGALELVLRRRSFLHLGTEVARTGGVPSDRATSAVRTVHRLRTAAEESGAQLVVAMATAALRDAGNGPGLLVRLERALDCPIALLSGEEEATLCFFGQRAGVWVGTQKVLGLDLGGGSLEAGVGNADQVDAVASVALGAARLRGELGCGERLSAADRSKVVTIAEQRAEPIRTILASHPEAGSRTIASGGTVRALARLAIGLHRAVPPSASARQVNQMELPAGQLRQLAEHLVDLDLDARLALPGMQARRASLLPIGAVILTTLVDTLGLSGLVVSDWGLREGAVLGAVALESIRESGTFAGRGYGEGVTPIGLRPVHRLVGLGQ